MKGIYNGTYMRAFQILPGSEDLARIKDLSQEAKRRLTWMDWYFTHGKNAEATCRHFSLSKSVFYRWLARFNKRNLETLEFDPQTRRPHRLREMTTPFPILKRIYDLRLSDLEMSKYEIHEELAREGIKVAHNVIQKVINRHPELQNTQHRQRLRKHRNLKIARIKAARELQEESLGSLVQIDTKYLYVLGVRFFLFLAIDCKSRYAFVWAYRTSSSSSAADFLLRVINYFPFPIQAINTDNGPEYLLSFHRLCEDLQITHCVLRPPFNYPHTPKMNGRVERLIRTAEEEFFNYQDDLLPQLEEVNRRCVLFNEKYNRRRFHQAINYQTPAEFVTIQLSQKGGQPFSI